MTRLKIYTGQASFLPRDYNVVLLCPDGTYMVWQEGLNWNEGIHLCQEIWAAMRWKHPQSGFVPLTETFAETKKSLESNRRKGLSA